MGNRETAIKNIKKGWISPNIGKHGPWLKTLEENKVRERYLQKLSEHFEEIVDIQIDSAKNVKGEKDRKEIVHQMVGKPVERMEIASVTMQIDV